MARWVTALCLVFAALSATAAPALTVHILPHTHADVGYKKTFEGYYQTEIRPILRSVTSALAADASRRFIWFKVLGLHFPHLGVR